MMSSEILLMNILPWKAPKSKRTCSDRFSASNQILRLDMFIKHVITISGTFNVINFQETMPSLWTRSIYSPAVSYYIKLGLRDKLGLRTKRMCKSTLAQFSSNQIYLYRAFNNRHWHSTSLPFHKVKQRRIQIWDHLLNQRQRRGITCLFNQLGIHNEKDTTVYV